MSPYSPLFPNFPYRVRASLSQIQGLELSLTRLADFDEPQREKALREKNIDESCRNCQNRIKKYASEDRNSGVIKHNYGDYINAQIAKHNIQL